MDSSPDIGLFRRHSLGLEVIEYCKAHSTPLAPHLVAYRASVAAQRRDAIMLSETYQSQMYMFLARSWATKRVLEIGLYVGYSAMMWSQAVGPDGVVTGLEVSPEFAQLAQKALADNRIDNVQVLVGHASETLSNLSPDEPYDLAFIDADKASYIKYLDQMLEKSKPGAAHRLLRPGAMIVVDNVLRWGHVVDDTLPEAEWKSGDDRAKVVETIRNFNIKCRDEPRLDVFVLPLWDGLTLARLVD